MGVVNLGFNEKDGWTLTLVLNGYEQEDTFFFVNGAIKNFSVISITLNNYSIVDSTLNSILRAILMALHGITVDKLHITFMANDTDTFGTQPIVFPNVKLLELSFKNTNIHGPVCPKALDFSNIECGNLVIEVEGNPGRFMQGVPAKLKANNRITSLELRLQPIKNVLPEILDGARNLRQVKVPLALLDSDAIFSLEDRPGKLDMDFQQLDVTSQLGIRMLPVTRYVRVPWRVLERLVILNVKSQKRIDFTKSQFDPRERDFMQTIEANLEGYLAFASANIVLSRNVGLTSFVGENGDQALSRLIFSFLHNPNAVHPNQMP